MAIPYGVWGVWPVTIFCASWLLVSTNGGINPTLFEGNIGGGVGKDFLFFSFGWNVFICIRKRDLLRKSCSHILQRRMDRWGEVLGDEDDFIFRFGDDGIGKRLLISDGPG